MTHQEKNRLKWLVNIAAACLAIGVILLVMRIDPGGGTLRNFIMAFVTSGPSSYSILSSVWALIKKGAAIDLLLGVIIFLCSVVFPTVKLGVFYSILNGGAPNRRLSEFVHKWGGSLCSMSTS